MNPIGLAEKAAEFKGWSGSEEVGVSWWVSPPLRAIVIFMLRFYDIHLQIQHQFLHFRTAFIQLIASALELIWRIITTSLRKSTRKSSPFPTKKAQ